MGNGKGTDMPSFPSCFCSCEETLDTTFPFVGISDGVKGSKSRRLIEDGIFFI